MIIKKKKEKRETLTSLPADCISELSHFLASGKEVVNFILVCKHVKSVLYSSFYRTCSNARFRVSGCHVPPGDEEFPYVHFISSGSYLPSFFQLRLLIQRFPFLERFHDGVSQSQTGRSRSEFPHWIFDGNKFLKEVSLNITRFRLNTMSLLALTKLILCNNRGSYGHFPPLVVIPTLREIEFHQSYHYNPVMSGLHNFSKNFPNMKKLVNIYFIFRRLRARYHQSHGINLSRSSFLYFSAIQELGFDSILPRFTADAFETLTGVTKFRLDNIPKSHLSTKGPHKEPTTLQVVYALKNSHLRSFKNLAKLEIVNSSIRWLTLDVLYELPKLQSFILVNSFLFDHWNTAKANSVVLSSANKKKFPKGLTELRLCCKTFKIESDFDPKVLQFRWHRCTRIRCLPVNPVKFTIMCKECSSRCYTTKSNGDPCNTFCRICVKNSEECKICKRRFCRSGFGCGQRYFNNKRKCDYCMASVCKHCLRKKSCGTTSFCGTRHVLEGSKCDSCWCGRKMCLQCKDESVLTKCPICANNRCGFCFELCSTCSSTLGFCAGCSSLATRDKILTQECTICEGKICAKCSKRKEVACNRCEKIVCGKCVEACPNCEERGCKDCVMKCVDCGKRSCENCEDFKMCESCECDHVCGDCWSGFNCFSCDSYLCDYDCLVEHCERRDECEVIKRESEISEANESEEFPIPTFADLDGSYYL